MDALAGRVAATIEARQQEASFVTRGIGIDAKNFLPVPAPESEEMEAESEPATLSDNTPAERRKKSPTVSPSYKRIEADDGKVYYRKVR
jgi:hypothetical protein